MERNTRWEPWMGIQIALRIDGMSQKELARRTGMSTADISRTVQGKRRLYVDQLLKIAEAQGRDLAWYLEGPAAATGGHMGGYVADLLTELIQPTPRAAAATPKADEKLAA